MPVPPDLKISDDGRYIVTKEGKPFVWIGDTAWELFHKLDREEAIEYLDDRSAKGFNVIQAVALAELDGLGTPNPYGEVPLFDRDPTRPNEAYFEHVDFVIDAAAQRGLHVGLLPTWGDKVPSRHSPESAVIFDPDNARAYGEYIARRYRDEPIIWILGGDRNIDSPLAMDIWNAMAEGIRSIVGSRHLMTYHPRGAQTSATWFADADWLDFHMYQIGHESRTSNLPRLARQSLQAEPRKPFVDGEPAYEDIAIRFWEYMDFSSRPPVPAGVLDDDGFIAKPEHFAAGFITAHDVRIHAYWDFLHGAAGYTYGHNAIWQMRKKGDLTAIPAFRDWRNAMQRPAASQMRFVRQLFESRPLDRLRPGGPVLAGDIPDGTAAAHASDRSYALVYLPDGAAVSVRMDTVRGPQARAWWYNPRNGESQLIDTFAAQGVRRFTPPSSGPGNDWLLAIDAADAGYDSPGNALKHH